MEILLKGKNSSEEGARGQGEEFLSETLPSQIILSRSLPVGIWQPGSMCVIDSMTQPTRVRKNH